MLKLQNDDNEEHEQNKSRLSSTRQKWWKIVSDTYLNDVIESFLQNIQSEETASDIEVDDSKKLPLNAGPQKIIADKTQRFISLVLPSL